MGYPFGQTAVRERRKRIPDPYNPDAFIPGPWDDPDVLQLPGAFVASSSSTSPSSATRSEILTTKSLYLTDATADVQAGDRIRVGATVYTVEVRPEADVNPWTGWQPAVEIPLKGVDG